MLFMSIFTFTPEKRDAVIRRRAEKGPMSRGKIMAEWITIGEGRIFGVVEADNPSLMLQAVMAWSDLGHTELVPIMNLEDSVKTILGQ
jgi:hypothetical protein